MARAAKLKVYRTAIGFHDAYVAAPSRKVALEAWGSDKDLFARGAAEIVTDEKLTAEPLASPGKVIKRLRGTAAEQMAALPPDKAKATTVDPAPRSRLGRTTPRKQRPPPPPSRSALETAEAALDDLIKREKATVRDLDRRQAELDKERRSVTTALAEERDHFTAARDGEAAQYDRAIKRWKEG